MFGAFASMLSRDKDGKSLTFDFQTRNRRPPTDPINSLLSFAYSLPVRSWSTALTAVGFDCYRGFYHQPRYGRPALSLDMMEPFRPLIQLPAAAMVVESIDIASTYHLSRGPIEALGHAPEVDRGVP